MTDPPHEGQPCLPICSSLTLGSLKDLEGVATVRLHDPPFKTPNFWSQDGFQKKQHVWFVFQACHQLLSLNPHLRSTYTHKYRETTPMSGLGTAPSVRTSALLAHVWARSHSIPHQLCLPFSSSRAFWPEKFSSWKLSEINPLACSAQDHLN